MSRINRLQLIIAWSTIVAILFLVGDLPAVGRASGLLGADQGKRGENAGLRLIASTADQVLMELNIPDFEAEQVEMDGQLYMVLSSPGLDESAAPGYPRLPQVGALVGLPPTGNWSVQILEMERVVIPLSHPLVPAPTPDRFPPGFGLVPPTVQPQSASDKAIYASNAFYPASPVVVGDVAVLRDLRVLPLSLYPFRTSPARGELEHIWRLVVQIRFEQPTSDPIEPTDAWDSLLERAVLNYDVARAWRGLRPQVDASMLNPVAATVDSFKVEVNVNGLYQITRADLQAVGFPVDDIDPRSLRLTLGGQEVAVWVQGQEDGRLDPGDRLLFYGFAAQSRFTDVNVYWLSVDETPGLRMAQRNVTPMDIYPTPASHRTTIHFEENHLYDSKHAESNGDHWYWTDLGFLQTDCPTATQTYAFELPQLWAAAPTATLRINLQGYTPGAHHLAARINRHYLSDILWTGPIRKESEFLVDASWLLPIDNTLWLENADCPPPPPPSPSPNGMALNYFEIGYQAVHVAAADALQFWGEPGNQQYNLGGFSSSNIIALDTTNSIQPFLLTGGQADPGDQFAFQDSVGQPRRYLVVGESAISSPRALYQDAPSSLALPSNSADYLLIGYSAFLPAVQPLLDLRAAQGLQVMSVDVQDVYDEFSHGLLDPESIRDFLAHTMAQWQLSPTYVLLVGDGSIDFLDHLNHGWHNFVPAYPANVDPYLGETVSDNRLACVVGDDALPDLNIGRLPVSSLAETEAVVTKIVAYEMIALPGSWQQRALLIADDDPADFFAQYSDQLYHSLPQPMWGERIHLATPATQAHEYDPTDAEALLAAQTALWGGFNRGQLLVTFMGHSSHSQWAEEKLLYREGVPGLDNSGRLPVVLSLTCYTGAFHHPPYAPLDERLAVEVDGGAVAAWGATGAGVATGHRHLAHGFFGLVFGEEPRTLGAATYAGKLKLYQQSPVNRDLVDTYVLLGDPATSLYPYIGKVYSTYLPQMFKSTPVGLVQEP